MRAIYRNGTGVRRYIRKNRFAEVATQNFLTAFGVYLAESGWGREEILKAFSEIDSIMDRNDNAIRLEELAQIRLEIRG